MGLLIVLQPASQRAWAQDDSYFMPQPPYNGLVAAHEAYRAEDARRRALVARQRQLVGQMVWSSAGYGPWNPGPFEPWPLVPGDIWGYPLVSPVPQPIDQQQMQIGPDRWISFPVYEPHVLWQPAPLPHEPQPAIPQFKPSGPREF